MPRQISRDPFARTTLMRRSVRSAVTNCDWCGEKRRDGVLYQYGTENDGISKNYVGPHWHKGLFCSKQCHDDYHG